MRSEFGWSKAVLIWDGSDLGWFVQNGGHFVQTIPKPNKMAAILFGFGMVHPITIALAMMDHSKTEPSQNQSFKCSVLGWCLVFRVHFQAPTVYSIRTTVGLVFEPPFGGAMTLRSQTLTSQTLRSQILRSR